MHDRSRLMPKGVARYKGNWPDRYDMNWNEWKRRDWNGGPEAPTLCLLSLSLYLVQSNEMKSINITRTFPCCMHDT